MKGWIMGSLIIALGASVGCGSDGGKVDLGNDKVAKTGEKLSDYAGNWKGYAEAFHFDDSSDAIAIKLDAHGGGVIEVGEADPLPPPKADEPYPPQDPPDPLAYDMWIRDLYSGFSYPISGAKVQSKRIQFQTFPGELERGWCELQTPVLDEVNTEEEQYGCLPNVRMTFDDKGCYLGEDKSMPVPCAKFGCKTLCTCTKSSCEPVLSPDFQVQFDAALESDGEELVGTLERGDRITVRLMRE